ncbi:MAG: hypothetical protein V4635_07055 [Bacteroidota bacterium]
MKNLLITLSVLACFKFQAQSIDLKWSDQFIYDNKLDGFFDYYIGTNGNNIYARFSDLSMRGGGNNKIKIIAFDKTTMKKVGETNLKGYNKSKKEEDYDYYQSIILDDIIYVLWTKTEKKIVELYAQSFDAKLKKLNPLKKIYEVNRSKDGTDNLIVLYNKNIDDKIFIGKEYAITKDDENLKIEYKFLNADFSLVSSKQVTLPILITKRRRGLFRSVGSINDLIASYELGNDGNLYIQEMVKVSDEEKKTLKRGEASVYPHVMQVQLETGSTQDFKLKFPKKNTFNFSSLVTKDGVKLYGFFSDLDKDEKGNDTHGTFFISLDSKTLKTKDMKFSYFDKTFLDQLYAADKENQKKGRGLFKSKKAKASDEESIDDNYKIERVIEDKNDIILFCSIMKNWQRTVCTSNGKGGGQTCHTYYYCTKSNVTAFKLNPKGDIVWARNLDRSITYPRWNVYDLNVIKTDNNYYVTYGSAYQLNSKKKNMRSSKSGKQMTDRLEYAVFSGATGDFQKQEYKVNPLNVKKSEAKFVSPDDIDVFDNRLYTSCMRTKLKPATYISCLCPPVFYFLSFSGNSRKGKGYLGTISALK